MQIEPSGAFVSPGCQFLLRYGIGESESYEIAYVVLLPVGQVGVSDLYRGEWVEVGGGEAAGRRFYVFGFLHRRDWVTVGLNHLPCFVSRLDTKRGDPRLGLLKINRCF